MLLNAPDSATCSVLRNYIRTNKGTQCSCIADNQLLALVYHHYHCSPVPAAVYHVQ